MAGTVTQAELRRRVVEAMEDDLQVSNKQAKDFVDSLFAVVAEALAEGSKVNLFGLVNIKPSFRLPLPKRKATDPRTGEEVTRAARPGTVVVRATVPKKLKDELPQATSNAGKSLRADAEGRREAATKRAAQREKEARKLAKV